MILGNLKKIKEINATLIRSALNSVFLRANRIRIGEEVSRKKSRRRSNISVRGHTVQ